MDENRKKAYRYLLYRAAIFSKMGLGDNPRVFVRRRHRRYITETRAVNYWLHNLAFFNYQDDWKKFSERQFWGELFEMEKKFPRAANEFKFYFKKIYLRQW